MSRADLLKARRGVESESVVVLFTRRTCVILQRSNGSLVAIEQPLRHHNSGGGGDASMRREVSGMSLMK